VRGLCEEGGERDDLTWQADAGLRPMAAGSDRPSTLPVLGLGVGDGCEGKKKFNAAVQVFVLQDNVYTWRESSWSPYKVAFTTR
jgi:hypothetical protein